jgi:predicted cobalt transporter CbtA
MTVRFVSVLALVALAATPALADDPVAATPAPAAGAAMPAPATDAATPAPGAATPAPAAGAAASAPADGYASLPAGAGRDVTVRICAQCHSPEVVAHQNLDAQGWKDLVNQMANNGANGTDADFDTISKYLTTAFPQH